MELLSKPPHPGGFFAPRRAEIPLAEPARVPRVEASMISPETFSHLENIKKRAGYLWRFL
jgi:hypothetical protein